MELDIFRRKSKSEVALALAFFIFVSLSQSGETFESALLFYKQRRKTPPSPLFYASLLPQGPRDYQELGPG